MKIRKFYEQRPLVCVTAVYILGLVLGFYIPYNLPIIGIMTAFSAAYLALGIILKRKPVLRALPLCLCAGILFCQLALHPALPETGKYTVSGTAAGDYLLRADGKASGYLDDCECVAEDGEAYRFGRLYWTYMPDEEEPFLPAEGDRVTFTGTLYEPAGQTNPFGFNFRLYLLQSGAKMGVSGYSGVQITGHPGRGLSSFFFDCRKKLSRLADDVFGEDSNLPRALLLGLRADLPEEITKSFRDAGAAHILAVSGLHVGLLAGVVMLLLKKILRPGIRLAVLSALLFMYAAMLDFSAPVLRAALFLVLLEARRLYRRAPDMLTTLAAAALVILLLSPLDVFSASFQLSFCAVLGICTFQERISGALGRRLRPVRDGIATTVSATAGTFLPSVQLFHRFSLVGLAVNPLLCALFSLLLPLYALALLLGGIWLPLGRLLAVPVGAIDRALIGCVEFVSDLPFATLNVPYICFPLLAALVLTGVLFSGYALIKKRRALLLSLCALAVAVCCCFAVRVTDVQYIQLSAGQADAAVLTDGRETILIDTGEYGGDMADYLLATGRNADRVILTHLHSDHCGGILDLIGQDVKIGEIYLPEGAFDQEIDDTGLAVMAWLETEEIPVRFLASGDVLTTSRCSLTVLWPQKEKVHTGQDPNNYTLAMLVDLDGVSLLSAGDIPTVYEMYACADADLLKVGHHGSAGSTSEDYLSFVTPELALITSSGHARYLPSADTLARLEAAGTRVLETGKTGAVTVTVHEGKANVTPYLGE